MLRVVNLKDNTDLVVHGDCLWAVLCPMNYVNSRGGEELVEATKADLWTLRGKGPSTTDNVPVRHERRNSPH